MKLYDCYASRNGYKVRLLASHMGIQLDVVDVNILKGGTDTQEFLIRNPTGCIPILELPDGRCLSESSAILWYLAEGSAWLPQSLWDQSKVLQWMCFEQYFVEPNISTLRNWILTRVLPMKEHGLVAEKRENALKSLRIMDSHLEEQDFFVGDSPTIADFCLFAYTSTATDAGFDLAPFGNIWDWMERLRKLPAHFEDSTGYDYYL